MKKITRADLRGKPLDKDCQKAHRTTNEYGEEDNRVFCYGLMDCMTEELLPKCMECKANVIYEEPLKRSDNNAEEFKQPVTFGDLKTIIDVVTDDAIKMYEKNQESLELVVTKLIDGISNECYERVRFQHFILALICKIMLIDKEKVETSYKEYCKAFDELNKKQKGSGDNA